MKGEIKIVELLSRSLKKADQVLERMDKRGKKMELAYDILIKQSEEMLTLREKSVSLRKNIKT